jgi:hypothetical protein
MAHRVRSVLLLVGLSLAAMLAAPGGVLAQPCTPQYIHMDEDPTHDVLVGCCNANGTWKSGTNSQRECINPSNMCQRGHCDGNPNSTCNASYINAGGDCVLNDGQFCSKGTCQQQLCTADSDPDLIPSRCDDNNQCTDDSCNTSTSTYTQAACTNTDSTQGTSCDLNPGQTCRKGECNGSGDCDPAIAEGDFCGTVSGSTCTPATCNANGDCVQNGDPFTCTGTLQTCRKWQCAYNGTVPTCTQVKVNSEDPNENGCDTDAHDCKIQTCGPKGKCNASPQPAGTFCDTNFTTPLTDCYAGQCDSRKNCENESIGYFGHYDGVPCGAQDNNVCTTQACSGLTCTTTCNTGACTACGYPGTCGGTPPNNCTCTVNQP